MSLRNYQLIPDRNLTPAGEKSLATLGFFVLLSSSVLLTSCGGEEAGGAGGGMQMPPTLVEIARVESRTVQDGFHALGSVEAVESIEVVSEINAIVVELPFVEGQPVSKGDLIARLDDREIGAESRRASALVQAAENNHERAKKLRHEGAISEQELERSQTQLLVAEANAAVSEARFEKTRIRAPFSGVVGRRRISNGAYLRTGEVITEIGRLDRMRIAFSAPERLASRLKPGVRVSVLTTAYPDEIFEGRLTVVDPIIDPTTRTIQLIAEVPNPSRKLKPGMSANVTAVLDEREEALVIPDEAVFAQGNQSFVFVVNPDSSVSRTAVQLGTRESSRVEILGGLEDGDMVVRAGHQKIYEGARVLPIDPDAPPPPQGAGGAGGAEGVDETMPSEDGSADETEEESADES